MVMGLSPAARLLMKNQLGIKIEPRSEFGTPSIRDMRTPSSNRSTVSTRSMKSASASIKNLIRTPVQKLKEKEYPETPDHISSKKVAKKAVAGLLNLQPNIDKDKRPKAVDFD